MELQEKGEKSHGLAEAPAPSSGMSPFLVGVGSLVVGVLIGFGITFGAMSGDDEPSTSESSSPLFDSDYFMDSAYFEEELFEVDNYCHGTNPLLGNIDCMVDDVVQAVEQAGGNVTLGWKGQLAHNADPINTTLKDAGLCPVNVHMHLGAEHLSVGEYDDDGVGPDSAHRRRMLLEENVRLGGRCHYYDDTDARFTTEYDWQYCVDMHVGETYEVHWPHSNMGACNTPYQLQSPFYDGVFCNMLGGTNVDGDVILDLSDPQNVANQVGVQGQIFTVINDEDYYDPNLIRGMLVTDDIMGQEMGMHITGYTGSTTGTTRDNTICSSYAPITWHVDRKCHLISASSFDKMCKDMLAQVDDMHFDLHPHGAREHVDAEYNADNQFDLHAYHDVQ